MVACRLGSTECLAKGALWSSLVDTLMPGALLRFLSSERIVAGGAQVFGQMHRGSKVSVETAPGARRVHLEGPPHLSPPLFVRCFPAVILAALDVGGAKEPRAALLSTTPTRATYEVTWT